MCLGFRWMTRTATNFYISIIFRPMYRMKYRCVTLTKKYPAQNKRIVLTHKCACYNHAILWIDWAYLKFESSENATFSSGEMIDAKTEIVIDK